MHNPLRHSSNAAPKNLNLRTDAASTICLPDSLLGAVPPCAIDCIQEFILDNYSFSQCSLTDNLNNLCTQATSSGLTIGEGSLQCLLAKCSTSELLAAEGVYNICNDIPGALPNTVQVITATIETPASSTSMATAITLPATIGSPATTLDMTSIVMASGSPVSPTTTAPQPPTTSSETLSLPSSSFFSNSQPSPSIAGTSTFPGVSTSAISVTHASTASAAALAEPAHKTQSLQTNQIIGIAVGSAAVAITVLTILFIYCRRKDHRASRRRSKRVSVCVDQIPPPHYEGPTRQNTGAKVAEHALMTGSSPTNRYYAVPPAEQKRRSFWRKSIKPDEIGVAVSPNVFREASSPASFSFQQSMLALLPKVPTKIPGQLLWPAPLNLPSGRRERPVSDTTVFDEDMEAQPKRARISEARDSIHVPRMKRQKPELAPLNLYPITPDMSPESQRRASTRIPLTPTYDNGNVKVGRSPPHGTPPSRWSQLGLLSSTKPLTAVHEAGRQLRDDREGAMLQKPASGSTRTDQKKTNARGSPPSVLTATRKDSDSTVATDIEDEITPKEQERRPTSARLPRKVTDSVHENRHVTPEPRSPVSELTYPAVPRSAAISHQAETAATPGGFFLAPPPRKGPSRSVLIRNESSFIVTDTTSSDGHMSGLSMEWPAPPRSSSLKTGMLRLRENPSGAHRPFGKPVVSLDQVMKGTANSQALVQPYTAPQAKLKPASSLNRGRGEMYFTVEL